jgi:hemicentin
VNYKRDATTGYCILDCSALSQSDSDTGIPCQHGSASRQILEFHLVALPSGITANQDLIRLLVYDQNNVPVTPTSFTLIDDDDTSPDVPFAIRTEDGKGVVYTTRPLADRQSYQLKVEGIAYDYRGHTVLYHTTFMIYISVSLYPY